MSVSRREMLADGVEIWLGDCREVLPQIGGVDAVVTDPVWPNAPTGMFPVSDPRALLANAFDLIECKRAAIVMRTDSDPRFLGAVPARLPFVRTQNLPYACPGHIGRVLGGLEVVYGFGSPIRSAPGQRVIPGNGPSAQPQKERFEHPCVRNPAHMRFVVRWWSDLGEIVCDPFMGTGTTAMACVALGRRFVGIEIDPGYFEIARTRITQAMKQPDFFVSIPVPVEAAL